jgi:hypothetical protein
MTARELPPAEWHRLQGTPLGEVVASLRPSCCRVVVVENEAGRIVGHWMVITATHAEAVWVDPDHQKRGAVARKLWTLMSEIVRSQGASHVFTAAESPDVAALIERHQGVKLPGTHYMLPVGA